MKWTLFEATTGQLVLIGNAAGSNLLDQVCKSFVDKLQQSRADLSYHKIIQTYVKPDPSHSG